MVEWLGASSLGSAEAGKCGSKPECCLVRASGVKSHHDPKRHNEGKKNNVKMKGKETAVGC